VFDVHTNLLYVVTGPSGAGKTTLIKRLLDEEENLDFSVSFTTRQKRPGEKEGVDYRFVSPGDFEERIDSGDFLEYADVHGKLYGTSKSYVERALENSNLLLDIDVQGAMNVKREFPDSTVVFIAPPTYEDLEKRLRARGTETPEDLEKRLSDSRKELKLIDRFDYLILNQEAEEAYNMLKCVYIAETLKVGMQSAKIDEFKKLS